MIHIDCTGVIVEQIDNENVLSVREVGERYGVSRASLYRYIRSGKVRAYQRGTRRETYVDRRDLDDLFRLRLRSGTGAAVWQRMREFQTRVFGDRVLSSSAAALIREGRDSRDAERGW
jgi:hypothetical protein